MSFKKFLAFREQEEAGDNNNKDWRKKTAAIQIEKGFVPPPFLRPIITAFLESGDIELQHDTSDAPKMKKKSLFLVGGAVRDFLKGKSPKDYDVATNATPAQVAMILSQKGGFKVRGKKDDETGKEVPDYDRSGKQGPPMKLGFDPEIARPGDNKVWYLTGRDSSDEKKPFVITASVGGNAIEIATFRKDAKVTDGAAEVDLVDNPIDDAARRDLTINSLFIELTSPDGENKKLYDPTKQGWHDAMHGVVRTVGKASDRFEEDKLRIMRAIRFHCRFGKGYKMHQDIEDAIPKFLNLKGVALERVREEFLKGLLHPDVDPKCYLSIYSRTGLIRKVFPEVKIRTDIPKQFRDKRDKSLALAWMLQDNPVESVSRVLGVSRRSDGGAKQTGWTVVERKAVEFLLRLKEFDPEHVDEMMNKQVGTGLDSQQIKDWVDMFNLTGDKGTRSSRPAWAKQIRTYADFEDDPREKISWQEKIRCPNCRGKGCTECKKGSVMGGIHPEIVKRGMGEVEPTRRGEVVKQLNKERLAQRFRGTLEPEQE